MEAVEADGVDGAPAATDVQKTMKRAERFGMPVQLSEEDKRDSRAEGNPNLLHRIATVLDLLAFLLDMVWPYLPILKEAKAKSLFTPEPSHTDCRSAEKHPFVPISEDKKILEVEHLFA
ncbi:unnamed protein product [Fraxinus pennsylvanica]|uniref:THO1-MOS11 C-terminal domain-containing protein n=1 Tax=Fraxinus pennsylvanica TaxID=56036 RepID=A0AAD2DXX5_9LAMI|nr:unnamed protein product [Fraxinus pennsylvanica]